MYREGFQKIFWGFILVLIELHIIVIDILPDPVGYYLIFSGLGLMANRFPASEKAKNFALGLALLSIPTVFIQNNAVDQMGTGSIFSGWALYLNIIGILNLVLVYYIFRLMITIVEENGDLYLQSRTANTFKVYMIAMLIVTFSQSFAMNMTQDVLIIYTILSVAVSLIMHIVFLVLVHKFSKLPDKTHIATAESNESDDELNQI